MIIEDSLGLWLQLGTLSLSEEYQLFPVSIINSRIFRFSYFPNWDSWNANKYFRSRALIRFYYPSSQIIVGKSIVLYPKQELEIRNLPEASDIALDAPSVRDLGAKILRYRGYRYKSELPSPWNFKAECLV